MTNSQKPKVEMFTDGACSGNPGPGGWGCILRSATGHEKELSGGEKDSTNNRMEMMAVIKGLESLKQPCNVTITTDSKYVLQGATEWLDGWKKKGWKGANRQEIKNKALWQKMDELLPRHHIKWKWIKGHSGHEENERADVLAVNACEGFK